MSPRQPIETRRQRERLLVCGVVFPDQPPEIERVPVRGADATAPTA
ncbi:MAG: hypothetical protein AAFP22_03315 [Planctomycetota bacterium]